MTDPMSDGTDTDTDSSTATARLTISQVMTETGRARSTVMRALKRGDLPGARQDSEPPHSWSIPVADLLALGWGVGRPNGPDETHDAPERDQGETEEVAALQSALERAMSDLAVATARLEERDRALRAAETALRALEAGRVPTVPAASQDGSDGLTRREWRAMSWRERRAWAKGTSA